MTDPQPIFCCEQAQIRKEHMLYKDPYRECHYTLYRSFLAFSERRRRACALMKLIREADSRPVSPPVSDAAPISSPAVPHQVLTPEALENSPVTPETPYVLHLITRHDFGPVISHRYFACPSNLEDDWEEATLVQWFANGEAFKLRVHKWDFKCPVDSIFYRLVLRPNLALRSMQPTPGMLRAWIGR